MRLRDKVVIVTGSSSGMGKAIALACAREGAKVVVHGRNEERVREVTEQVKAAGAQAVGLLAEMGDPVQVRRMVDRVIETFGRVDVLVNNAGGGVGVRRLEDTTDEDWEYAMGANLLGQFYCCKYAIPHMQKQGGGKIINVTSAAGEMQLPVELTSLPYAAAKAGLAGLTRQLAAIYGRDGITVNLFSPGDILTESQLPWWNNLGDQERQEVLASVQLGRLGEPEDITGPVVFLASSDADYMTGATLRVNGGQWM